MHTALTIYLYIAGMPFAFTAFEAKMQKSKAAWLSLIWPIVMFLGLLRLRGK